MGRRDIYALLSMVYIVYSARAPLIVKHIYGSRDEEGSVQLEVSPGVDLVTSLCEFVIRHVARASKRCLL